MLSFGQFYRTTAASWTKGVLILINDKTDMTTDFYQTLIYLQIFGKFNILFIC